MGCRSRGGEGVDVVWSQDAFLHSGDRQAVVGGGGGGLIGCW